MSFQLEREVERVSAGRCRADGSYWTQKKRRYARNQPLKFKEQRKRVKKGARGRRRTIVRAWFAEHPCVDCGERDVRCLDADHVRGEKAFAISGERGVSLKRLEAELEKCESRCANCHRRRHWEEMNRKNR